MFLIGECMEGSGTQRGASLLRYDIKIDGKIQRLTLEPTEEPDHFHADLDGRACQVDARLLEPGVLSLLIGTGTKGDKSYRILFDPRPGGKAIVLGERRISYRLNDPRSLRSRGNVDARGLLKDCSTNFSSPKRIMAPTANRLPNPFRPTIRLRMEKTTRKAQTGRIMTAPPRD